MIRVILADDHAVVRTGFRLLLQSRADIKVIAEAESGEAACQLYADHSPDVLVIDLGMPGIGGLEALRRIRAHDSRAKILALSAHDDSMYARRTLLEGALGFLSKRSAPEILLDAVVQVAAGRRFMDPEVATKLALSEFEGESLSPMEQLSQREFDVFLRLAAGATVARIAQDLNLSTSTVGTHLYNIKQKLKAVTQSDLTLIALKYGLLKVDPNA